MKLRNYFTLHTIIFVIVGVTVIFMPTLMADLTGELLTEPEGIQLSRLRGITVLCLAVLTWMTRDLKPSVALTGIVLALALWHGLDSLNMIFGIIEHDKAGIAWMFPVIHGLVALGFVSYLPRKGSSKS
jgi:hypothetical protein